MDRTLKKRIKDLLLKIHDKLKLYKGALSYPLMKQAGH